MHSQVRLCTQAKALLAANKTSCKTERKTTPLWGARRSDNMRFLTLPNITVSMPPKFSILDRLLPWSYQALTGMLQVVHIATSQCSRPGDTNTAGWCTYG